MHVPMHTEVNFVACSDGGESAIVQQSILCTAPKFFFVSCPPARTDTCTRWSGAGAAHTGHAQMPCLATPLQEAQLWLPLLPSFWSSRAAACEFLAQ